MHICSVYTLDFVHNDHIMVFQTILCWPCQLQYHSHIWSSITKLSNSYYSIIILAISSNCILLWACCHHGVLVWSFLCSLRNGIQPVGRFIFQLYYVLKVHHHAFWKWSMASFQGMMLPLCCFQLEVSISLWSHDLKEENL